MARRPVDIIIPVYKGYEVTKACIESVLASQNTIETNVYVINDASPEYELVVYLAWLSDNAPVTVLHNTCNRGFTRTVNRGFALNPEHDVILLNSDTLVYADWADRMARAAYSSHNIGTVTPFSNNATICSYPFINRKNPLPTEISPAELDEIFNRVNSNDVCELPTGVGFCMYFKRACLDDVGDFDDESFGRGYGEENDFCLRAQKHGWRSILAADVYVPHVGGWSFGNSRKPLLEKNLAVLNQRYTDYPESIRRFVLDDPLLRFRRAVDEKVITMKAGGPLMVRVCHGFGGGTAKRLRDEAEEQAAQGYRVATLRPATNTNRHYANLAFEDAPDCPNLTYELAKELDTVIAVLRQQNTQGILLHHFLGLDACVLDIPQMLGVPHSVIVHDYGWYCPRINLIDYTGKYCGEPDVDQCQRCVDINGDELGENLSVVELMARSMQIMQSASSVIAPCEDTATRVRSRLNLENVRVVPHSAPLIISPSLPSELDRSGQVRIAVIGGIGKHKGYDILLECARDAADRMLPIEFCIIGSTAFDTDLFATGKAIISGKYNENEFLRLIKKFNCHASIFLSTWPETWCYTLSNAFKSNLTPITLSIGATSERVANSSHGFIVEYNTPPSEINDYILATFSKSQHAQPQ